MQQEKKNVSDFDQVMRKVGDVLDVVDNAIRKNDYSNMSRDIGDVFSRDSDPKTASGTQRETLSQQQTRMQQYRERAAAARREQAQRAAQASERVVRPDNRTLNDGTGYYRGGHMQQNPYRNPGNGGDVRHTAPAPRKSDPYFAPVQSSAGKRLLAGLGITGAVICGFIGILIGVPAVIGALAGRFSVAALSMAVFFGLGAAASALFARAQKKAADLIDRYAKYKGIMSKKLYEDTKAIADQMDLPVETVIKELKQLTLERKFKQGHFDLDEKTFIASDEIYQQYLDTQIRATELRKQQEETEKENGKLPSEVRAVIERGSEYIEQIRLARVEIEDPAIRKKIAGIERTSSSIYEELRERGRLTDNLMTFTDYYLPTTAKLVAAYEEMEEQTVQGENVLAARAEIEGSLDTINEAFEKLLDSFYKEKAMDVSSDISVMKTLMKQEGLTPDDLEAMRQEQAAQAVSAAETAEGAQAQAQTMTLEGF